MIKIEIYKAKRTGQFYVRFKSKGRIVLCGGEGYHRRSTLLRTLEHTIKSIKNDKYAIYHIYNTQLKIHQK
jgi:uncharacterized protein YegP (UPF0339 family)